MGIIRAISNGWGESCDYFRVGLTVGDTKEKVTHILESSELLHTHKITVYEVYNNEKLLAKVYSGFNVTVWYQ